MPNISSQTGYLGSLFSQNMGKQNRLFDQNNQSLNWITGSTGDPTSSPLYKSFLTKAREATTNSYDTAIMNTRANAASRGFGYASPNENTAELGVRGTEAGALSGAPATALNQTMPYNMSALQLRAGEAGTFGSEGLTEEGLANQDMMTQYQQQQQNKRQLFSSLSSLAGLGLQSFGGSIFPSAPTGGTGAEADYDEWG
jgi:hypothetical protein